MPDFEKLVSRHGEFWVQAIIELMERDEGIHHPAPLFLSERWDALMTPASTKSELAIA